MKLQCKNCGNQEFTYKEEKFICNQCGHESSIEEAEVQKQNTTPISKKIKKNKEKSIATKLKVLTILSICSLATICLLIIYTAFEPQINRFIRYEIQDIALTDQNINTYCNIASEFHGGNIKSDGEETGYKDFQVQTSVTGKPIEYEYVNVTLQITSTVHRNEYIQGKYTLTPSSITLVETKIVTLDSYGNAQTTFVFYTQKGGIFIDDKSTVGSYAVKVLSGKLVPRD